MRSQARAVSGGAVAAADLHVGFWWGGRRVRPGSAVFGEPDEEGVAPRGEQRVGDLGEIAGWPWSRVVGAAVLSSCNARSACSGQSSSGWAWAAELDGYDQPRFALFGGVVQGVPGTAGRVDSVGKANHEFTVVNHPSIAGMIRGRS